jgi:hypothetical protein
VREDYGCEVCAVSFLHAFDNPPQPGGSNRLLPASGDARHRVEAVLDALFVIQLPRQAQAFPEQRRGTLVVAPDQGQQAKLAQASDHALRIACLAKQLQALLLRYYRVLQISPAHRDEPLEH